MSKLKRFRSAVTGMFVPRAEAREKPSETVAEEITPHQFERRGHAVRIVFQPGPDGQPAQTAGTRVLLADGTEVHGICRIELTAEPNDLWRARIDLLPSSLSIGLVDAVFDVAKPKG